jgi:hypothetical protein
MVLASLVGKIHLNELEKAMVKHMEHIVFVECRPFSYMDFENFEVDGRVYSIAHGTCRNKFSYLAKIQIIELEYNCKVSYYTLKGVHFGAKGTMTRNHMGDSSVINVTGIMGNEMEDLLNYLKTLPPEEASVHDIHYKFTVTDSYKIMSTNRTYNRLINPVSKDIILPPDIIDGLKIQTIIHRTDTVTVSVACSNFPIILNAEGLLRISVALTRAEERLSAKLDESGKSLEGGYERIPIPDNRRWLITMWHFGKDGNFEFVNGSCLTWGYGREVLRSYPKSIKNKKGQRKEKQEYPNKTNEEAFKEKLKEPDDKSDSKEDDDI